MIQALLFLACVLLAVFAYLKWHFAYGLLLGVMVTYILVTQRIFKRIMGRTPTDEEDNEIFKTIVGRSKR